MIARVESLHHWNGKPLAIGSNLAASWVIIAVAVPALIRLGASSFVMGCETIVFVPSVLLTALFLGLRYAAFTALISALVADILFLGHDYEILESGCDVFGLIVFLLASALIIASVEMPRRMQEGAPQDAPAREPTGIIFSLEGGQAFASWYGRGSPVKLGPEGEVAEMMRDFLAQLEVGRRLTARRA